MFFLDKKRLYRFSAIPAVFVLNLIGIGFAVYLFGISYNFYTYLLAAVFALLTGIATVFNTMAALIYYDSYTYEKNFKKHSLGATKMSVFPTVAVVVPTYNEEARVVKNTVRKLKALEYDKRKLSFYLLDDSTNARARSELEAFAKRNGVNYIHRDDRKGFKAGALNNYLSGTNEEFIAIFDADEYLVNRKFLTDLMPLFENPKIGYVQTEKKYARSGFFADSINLFNSFFFSFVQPSRAQRNTSIYAGSCGIVRRETVLSIGGFPEYVIEDTFLSFEARVRKYKGVYIPKTYALGRPMGKFSTFAKQQWRYNYGGTQFLSYYIKNAKKLTLRPVEHMDYFALGFGLNYLSVVLLLFTVLSVMIVFINFPFAQSISSLVYIASVTHYLEGFGLFVLALSFVAPLIVSRIYFGSVKYGVMIFFLNFALTFVRTRAAIAAVFKRDPRGGWAKGEIRKRGMLLTSLRNTRLEVTFALTMLALGILAFLTDNFFGGLWLLWYSVLYGSAFFLFYRYG